MCGRAFRAREKGDFSIGKTKVGKGSKVMSIANGNSLPIGLHIDSTQLHESVLAELIPAMIRVPQQRCDPSIRPGDLVADKAYDGQALLQLPHWQGIKPAIPMCVRRPKHGRPIRTGSSYSHRCKGERCFDWIANYRRLVERYERYVEHNDARNVCSPDVAIAFRKRPITISIIYLQKYSLKRAGAIGHEAYFQSKKDLRLLMMESAC
jgi:hypothetical protein